MGTARLVLLDAESDAVFHSQREEHLRRHVPAGLTALEPLRLSAFGCPAVIRTGPDARPVDWEGVGAAVVRLASAARKQGRDPDPPVHTFVAGFAPLPVFALAGFELSPWIGDLTLVNRRKGGAWDVLTYDESAAAGSDPFDVVKGLPSEPVSSSGLVAVWLTTSGAPPDPERLAAFCRETGHELAGVVEIRSSATMALGADNAGAAFNQIERTLSMVARLFRRRQGVALFLDGPATLAFLAGRAINPNVFGNVHVPIYVGGVYKPALALPWRGAAAGTVPPTTGTAGPAAAPTAAGPGERLARAPVTAVFFAASPLSDDHLQLDERVAVYEEMHDIKEKLRAAGAERLFRAEQCLAARPTDLLEELNRYDPAVVHFSGHGIAGDIVMQGEDRAPRTVDSKALVDVVRCFPSVRLVVLNACFMDKTAAALTETVECAVGMRGEAGDDAARVFSAAFYSALAFGRSVAEAFEQAKAALGVEHRRKDAAPHLRTRPGVDPAQIRLVPRD